jgi:FixJ family two-component response regulator
MKGISGPELVARMRAKYPGVKAVYMSGYTGELIAEREILESGIELLEKPFTRSALMKVIQSSLERS